MGQKSTFFLTCTGPGCPVPHLFSRNLNFVTWPGSFLSALPLFLGSFKTFPMVHLSAPGRRYLSICVLNPEPPAGRDQAVPIS